jgi:secreted PhoX family phosphatase
MIKNYITKNDKYGIETSKTFHSRQQIIDFFMKEMKDEEERYNMVPKMIQYWELVKSQKNINSIIIYTNKMNSRYKMIQTNETGEEFTKEYKTLKDIADDLEMEIHLICKINQLTEGRRESVRAHHTNRDMINNIKIHNIKKIIKYII